MRASRVGGIVRRMDLLIIISAGLKLLYALLAVLIVWQIVRLLRASTDRQVRATLDLIDSDAKAAAIYWGLTFFGICYLVGQAIG